MSYREPERLTGGSRPPGSASSKRRMRRRAMRVTTRAYLDGFSTACSVIELDHLTLNEILASLDPEQLADPSLTPWKRGYQAGIRAAFGR
jgi:hypothetical protein